MNKTQLVDVIAAEVGLTKNEAKKALDAVLKGITNTLKDGDRVSLVGFGSFSVSLREARTGVNPQTRKEIQIPAKKVVRFKAGSDLSNSVQ